MTRLLLLSLSLAFLTFLSCDTGNCMQPLKNEPHVTEMQSQRDLTLLGQFKQDGKNSPQPNNEQPIPSGLNSLSSGGWNVICWPRMQSFCVKESFPFVSTQALLSKSI